jgi:lysophospholipase L1-like esterase
MIQSFFLAAILIMFASNTFGQTPPAREGIEWCDVWISHANETNLPRVLLIGDSITRGYYPDVVKRLVGKAYVNRLATSAFISDPVLLAQIKMVLDGTKFDVIQFNNGMHGWQHSEEEYRQAFPEFLAVIRDHARGAKLIWATTTSVKEGARVTNAPNDAKDADAGKMMLKADLTRVSNARINARNAIALQILQPQGIPIDDLHALTANHPEMHSDNVHFNARGIALQADHVAAEIQKLLAH